MSINAPFKRKYGTMVLNKILGKILNIPDVTDYTSGFFAGKKEDMQKLFNSNKTEWGEHGMEVLRKANSLGMEIKEIPTHYEYRTKGDSKSPKLIRVAWIYIKKAIGLRLKNVFHS